MIFDALLKSAKGDIEDVFKYIRVERAYINRRYSTSAVTIEPQLHVDAALQQITMDRRLASLPPSLQSLNLFNLQGEVVLANRGILEFSDLLKRPLDAFKYLLMTMESKTINLQGILTELDIFFIGSSNEIHLTAFRQHPDFNSFKGRFTFLRVPYLLNAEDEMSIYKDQIENLKGKVRFEPHALETLCYWAVMTRIRPCMSKFYTNAIVGKIASNLNPLQKALYLTSGTVPEDTDTEGKQLLKQHQEEIAIEFENEGLYEGKFGISPREIKQIIYEIAAKHKSITFIEVLDFLNEFIERKNDHDFLNMAVQGDYHNPRRFIELLDTYEADRFDSETRECLGLVDERSYEEYIARYILNINAMMKGEKIKNPITGRSEPPDQYFVQEFENNIGLHESPQQFRSNMLSTLGAYHLDHKGKALVYTDVFVDIVKQLQESFRNEQKKLIDKISKNLLFFMAEKGGDKNISLTEENRQTIDKVLTNLMSRFHYSEQGALTLLRHLLEKKY